jgi:hypothetical protein
VLAGTASINPGWRKHGGHPKVRWRCTTR